MSESQDFAGTMPVQDKHRFDTARLEAWMRDHVPGFKGPLEVEQFKGGQSNPTYRLDTPARSYVLRRKPFGPLLPSAHAVDREFRVISALWPNGFPVARPYALCEDDGVIGTAFYVMEKVEGRIFWDGRLPDLPPEERGDFLASLGVESSGLDRLIRAGYHLLGLQTFFTAGDPEVRAWTIHRGDTAPTAAGVIHTDFERGFIRAETASYDDFVASGGWKGARERGVVRSEGRDYVVQDGDVMLFRFNV